MGSGSWVKPEPGQSTSDDMSRPAVSAPSPLAASPSEEPSSPEQRTVYAGDASKNDFCDNRVITSKYTWWNFLFLFLWAKFRVRARQP